MSLGIIATIEATMVNDPFDVVGYIYIYIHTVYKPGVQK